MSTSDSHDGASRRSFLKSSGGLFTGIWVATHWPAMVAAHHMDDAAGAAPTTFEFFTPAEAADVEALSAQIVPSGATPGAREAHAVYFIDRSLKTYFAGMAAPFREGLQEFQAGFHTAMPSAAAFAAASSTEQIAYMKTVDHTPFFDEARMLTILGMFTSPKYGGNFQGLGWKMLGFVDQHAFTPPFGYYDRDYPGFVPYAEKHS
jgi:gluconate 2-dehydrogenase gamma chain